jgi:hypothetical protein
MALHARDQHKIVPPSHDAHLFGWLVFMSRRKT